MKLRHAFWIVGHGCFLSGAGLHAAEKSDDDQVIEQVEVQGLRASTMSVEVVEQQHFIEAGASTVVDMALLQDKSLNNQSAILETVPGVFSSPLSAGTEALISIRGSGVSQTANGRGIKTYQDGVLLNMAGGGSSPHDMDLQSLKMVEVFRGSQASVLAAGVSGGAVHYRTLTGADIQAPKIRIEVGSFESKRATVKTGQQWDNSDGFISLTHFETDGQREHEAFEQNQFSANWGWQMSDVIQNRVYLSYSDVDLKIAGGVRKAQWLEDPLAVDDLALRIDQRLKVENIRLSDKFDWFISDAASLELTTSITKTEASGFPAPPDGIIEDTLQGVMFSPKYSHQLDWGNSSHFLTASLGINRFDDDLKKWQASSDGQDKEYIAFDGNLKTNDWDWFLQDRWVLNEQWQITAGLQKNFFKRKFEDRIFDCTAPNGVCPPGPPPQPIAGDDSYAIDKSALNYQLGLSYFITQAQHLFTGFSTTSSFVSGRELNGMFGFTDPEAIDLQEAKTVELGYKFKTPRISGEVTAYYSQIEDAILEVKVPNVQRKRVVTNIGDTIHSGIELGVNAALIPQILQVSFIYNYMDFHFNDHALYGNNPLPRTPDHFGLLSFNWHITPTISMQPNIRYVAEQTSTYDLSGGDLYKIESYTLLNLRLAYQPVAQLSTFIDWRNLSDEVYIASGGAQETATSPDGTRVAPGIQRSIYAGFEWQF